MSPIRIRIYFVIMLLALVFFNFKLQESKNQALVKFVIGTAELQSKQQTSWKIIALNSPIVEGDRIKTSLNSRVEIAMPDETILKINENTIFDVNEIKTPEVDNEDKMKFTLWAGNIWGQFKKIFSSRQEREIESPSAIVAIRGTTIEMDVDQNQNTLIKVEEGNVLVRSKDIEGEVMVGPNQETYVEKGKAPTEPSGLRMPELKEGEFNINFPKLIYTDPSVLRLGVPLSGTVRPQSQLFIDDRPVPVTGNGSFDTRIPVSEGLNSIKVRSVSAIGEQSKDIKFYVNTKKPEIRLSTPIVADFYNRRDYSLNGGVFDLTPGDKITVYINQEEVAQVIARGSFNRTIVLEEGLNQIRVVARDRSGNTTEISQRIFLDTVKPILTVTDPAEQRHIRPEPPPPPGVRQVRSEKTIRGLVIDPQPSSGIKRLTLNGKEIKPNSDGSFAVTIPLRKGDNRLNFMIEDLAGNILHDSSRIIHIP